MVVFHAGLSNTVKNRSGLQVCLHLVCFFFSSLSVKNSAEEEVEKMEIDIGR